MRYRPRGWEADARPFRKPQTMDTSFPRSRTALTLLFLACSLGTGTVQAHAINGAIYTSAADGETVNGNNYASKSMVYLNGGPNNAGCNGGDLDEGTYYFQVTDPDGNELLSSDGIAERKFEVVGGVVAINLGSHVDADDAPDDDILPSSCGSVGIQLMPYDDTPNAGGVYKVWITRVGDFHAACDALPNALPGNDCGLAGFVNGHIKTDNFRVEETTPPPPTKGSIESVKFYDANANGAYDDGEVFIANWEMILESVNQSINSTQVTDALGSTFWHDLNPDIDYTVEERLPVEANWYHSTTIYAGHDGSPVNPAGPLTVVAGETTTVIFGNYCTVPSNGRTLGFWSNKNGQALVDGGDLSLLVALNLRNASGGNFDPANYAALRTWLLKGEATNMAYMLSVQMAAMQLNVQNAFVNGDGYYVPAGMTVNELLTAANDSLLLHGYTPAGNDWRDDQEQLKNWLDELNNGAGLLSPEPCAFSFPVQ